MGKLVISKNTKGYVTALLEGNDLVDVDFYDLEKQPILGNIYIGKVKNILKNINAAFVDIGMEENAYLAIEDHKSIIFTNHKKDTHLNIGDEIVVQVKKESTKTKGPVLTTQLSLTGRYTVLTAGKNYVGISNKIEDQGLKERLKNIVKPFQNDEYGFIIRTNAKDVEEDTLIKEMNELKNRYETIKKVAMYRSCYQIIEKAPSPFISLVKNHYNSQLERVVIDDKTVYDEVKAYVEEVELNHISVEYYEDKNLSLFDLNNLRTKIEQALKSKVWLKSGASIVISPTEALIAIDVNTGKYVGKKKFEETVYKINMEAAQEIAKQIRLRNLSGIIIVDFIDMKKESYKNELLRTFKRYLDNDPVKVTLLGMTALNLVEITRKKIKKPIYEQFGCKCNKCDGRGYVWDIDH
ncbi:ribonuclease G [Natranaerovirga hydrolytica]|uniref:Ribonuclease G n=1 Tax=Natranaerovirga hydrolytica TaxID=680378 RepID=A0A4R1MZW9_9FIRM|nr:Rne/Rng family ribonuclease [Natranaerovirga hydrolytica]TCK98132.1 ribonuclease G [Natranaerovirga hydrolytica]